MEPPLKLTPKESRQVTTLCVSWRLRIWSHLSSERTAQRFFSGCWSDHSWDFTQKRMNSFISSQNVWKHQQTALVVQCQHVFSWSCAASVPAPSRESAYLLRAVCQRQFQLESAAVAPIPCNSLSCPPRVSPASRIMGGALSREPAWTPTNAASLKKDALEGW
jgi:hypothetical protein